MLVSESIQLPKTRHLLIGPGIIMIEGVEGEHIELSDAIEMREANLKLSEGKPFCLLMNGISSFHTYSSEAKELFASEEYCKLRRGVAFTSNSLPVTLMAKFFINLNKPKSSSKVFSTREEALTWLKTIDLK